MKPILFFLLSMLLLPALASAEGSHAAEVVLTARKVVLNATPIGARESLEPLKEVRPGDTVEYEATYVNGTGQTAHDVNLTIPVPSGGMAYIAAQKSPLAGSASADGKQFAAMPLTRVEIQPNGERATRDVPLADYKALRWSLGDVPAGARRSVRARMQLSTAADDAAHR